MLYGARELFMGKVFGAEENLVIPYSVVMRIESQLNC